MEQNQIEKIVDELHRSVGPRHVVFWPEVPPGMSLQAASQAYQTAGEALKQTHPHTYAHEDVERALGTIYEKLNEGVHG